MAVAQQNQTLTNQVGDASEKPTGPIRCVSIDVEDYFQIEAAYEAIGPDRWDSWPSRVERNVDLLLNLFAKHEQTGTFFILGSVAEKWPAIAPKIAAAGHEIASHGTMHDRLHRLGPDGFRDDLSRSKAILEDQTGKQVIGYRAPTFSVTRDTAWAIDVLAEVGFEYDSSIFPVVHPAYGVPDAPPSPYLVKGAAKGATLLEVPPLTWRVMRRNVAVAGGGYFRLLPLTFMKRGLAQAAVDERPAILYFHPWEFDPDMPKMPLSRTGMIRTYTGLKSAAAKLDRIMATRGSWMSIASALPALREMADRRDGFTLT